jgi:hypothetical protein
MVLIVRAPIYTEKGNIDHTVRGCDMTVRLAEELHVTNTQMEVVLLAASLEWLLPSEIYDRIPPDARVCLPRRNVQHVLELLEGKGLLVGVTCGECKVFGLTDEGKDHQEQLASR